MKKNEDEQYRLAIKRLQAEHSVLPLQWFHEGRNWAMHAPWVELVPAAMDAEALVEGKKTIEQVGDGFPEEVLEKFRNDKATGCDGSGYLMHWSRGLFSFWQEAFPGVMRLELVVPFGSERARKEKGPDAASV